MARLLLLWMRLGVRSKILLHNLISACYNLSLWELLAGTADKAVPSLLH